MRVKKDRAIEESYRLDAAGIDAFSERLEEQLQHRDLERQNRLRIRLSLEEALLRMRERFGEDHRFGVFIGKRFGKPVIQISLDEEIYNPLSKNHSETSDWSGSLLTDAGMAPQYYYVLGRNILRITLPSNRMNPVLKLCILLLAGILLGVLLHTALAQDVRMEIIQTVIEPIYSLWNRILLCLSGPVIFLMVMTTVLNTGAVTEQGGSNGKSVFRYFVFSILMGLLTILACSRYLRLHSQWEQIDMGRIAYLVNHFFHIIPENFFQPIIEANTPQLLLMAFTLGIAMLVVGNQADGLKKLVRQANDIGLLLAEWISRLVPFMTAICICMLIMDNGIWMALTLPVEVLQALFISLLFMAFVLCYVCYRKKVHPKVLVKKVWAPFIYTLRHGNAEDSYGLLEHSSIHELGIQKHFVQATLPNGTVLYMPINVVGTVLFVIYAALKYNVQVTPLWYAIALILAVFLFVATPPVPGANLLAYIGIFSELGIGQDILVEAMIFDIMFGIFATGANQTMLQLELVLQSDKLGLLDRDRLRAPVR